MKNKQQYVTITHYKEREFYYLNYAVHTDDGFIGKEMEQFHESEKDKFIDRIRLLQSQYPQTQIISLSLQSTQAVTEKEDKTKASAKIFENNYVIQDRIDVGDIPTTLYFSPFAVLYEEYKTKLSDKLTLVIGLFDRKLYIMFLTKDKIHESWTIGTRGLTEKQVADRVYKSMKAYYKIAYKFADQIEMLITDDSPKLLKVLREELSLTIILRQNTIHNLLHNMGSSPKIMKSSFIKPAPVRGFQNIDDRVSKIAGLENEQLNLEDIVLNDGATISNEKKSSFFKKIKSFFKTDNLSTMENTTTTTALSFLPLVFVFGLGSWFSMQNDKVLNNIHLAKAQSIAQSNNELLVLTAKNIFSSMGKNAELKKAVISNSKVDVQGIVWGIEPLKNSFNELYENGEFEIRPLENFMTEFSFKSKV